MAVVNFVKIFPTAKIYRKTHKDRHSDQNLLGFSKREVRHKKEASMGVKKMRPRDLFSHNAPFLISLLV